MYEFCYDELLISSIERYPQSQNSCIDVHSKLSAVSDQRGSDGKSTGENVEKSSAEPKSWYELGLASYEGIDLDQVSNNEELLIGDTEESTHIIYSRNEIINLIKPKSKVEVVMGNSEKIERDMIGTVKGDILNKNGK